MLTMSAHAPDYRVCMLKGLWLPWKQTPHKIHVQPTCSDKIARVYVQGRGHITSSSARVLLFLELTHAVFAACLLVGVAFLVVVAIAEWPINDNIKKKTQPDQV
jgi:hypothetical protein